MLVYTRSLMKALIVAGGRGLVSAIRQCAGHSGEGYYKTQQEGYYKSQQET